MRVYVPLKTTLVKGTIAKIKSESTTPGIKPIAKLISVQTEIQEPLWKLAHWMAKYYGAPLQRVLKCFIPVNIRKEVARAKKVLLKVAKTHDESIALILMMRKTQPKQAELLEAILNAPKGLLLSEIEHKSAALQLRKKKLVQALYVTDDEDLLLSADFFATSAKTLNDEQARCLKAIEQSLDKGGYAAHLIYGVTGSGKTEVYMQAIQHALANNRSAILLVPEISLTSQTIERLRARFREKIAILHHRRSLGERSSAWEELKKGEAKLVIGARSAIFAPAQNLGLIIVDEEHDSSYKQSDEVPCYHGRDVAIMRAYLEGCPILLGSATPSIESRYNAQIGKYQLHELKQRAASASMPKVKIVDMAETLEKTKGFTHFSDPLLLALKQRLEKGEQTLLLLNRRGYHRSQVCSACRHIIKCSHCDLALTFHREERHLQCHLCGYHIPPPRNCPECKSAESLQFKGFGTEHVERALHAIFPEVRTLRMDRDTTSKKTSHEDLFKQFRSHKADVLIGTQMIAKGFHFPSVTLVGVLNADSSLQVPDFRSSEQLFQLLTQVAGRAGRAELLGEVIIQTFLPDHPTIQLAAAQNYDQFYSEEIQERKTFGYPPFCKLIKLLFTDLDESVAKGKAEAAFEQLKRGLPPHVILLPVTAAGHAKIKDQYRYQFLIKTDQIGSVIGQLANIKAKIDVDPQSTYF
jgi:primosomal protein N' (replication factor Y)